RTAPLGSLVVPGCPYTVRVLRVGHSTARGADGTLEADGTVTLISGGPVTALVDTGGPWDRPLLPRLLAEHGVTPDDVTHVIVTHGHSDHVGNVNLFPAATLLVGFDLSRGPGLFLPHGLARGVPLALDPPALEVVATPGHTRAHVSLVVRGTALGTVAVAGDTFERQDDEDEWGALSEDPPEQLRSRQRLLAMADVIVPGHGPPFRVIKGDEPPREG
ncbi:MBLC1 protein, partial [Grallaria varia]|nr:MBLC1 protein [Grallaria varia]